MLHRFLLYKLNVKKSELLELGRFLWNTDLLFLEKCKYLFFGVQHLYLMLYTEDCLCYIDITC